jgi:dihydroorotate dehydrogenase (fumarate)
VTVFSFFFYLTDISEDTISKIRDTKKPYIVSISGLSLEDNMTMLFDRIVKVPAGKIAAVELNLACPNIPNKPMPGYDFEQFENVLKTVTRHPQFRDLPPLGLKLPPYFDMPHFDRVAAMLAQYPIKYIVCINSVGNGLVVDWENECEGMAAKSGLGGLGGGFVKHTALANVRNFYKLLNEKYNRPDIDIIGVGGVHTGKDAFELILCGAKAIQVGTCHWTEGSTCFTRIGDELIEIMKLKGYKNIEDFRGKLKSFINKPSSLSKGQKKEIDHKPDVEKDGNENKAPPEAMVNTFTMLLMVIILSLLARDFFAE